VRRCRDELPRRRGVGWCGKPVVAGEGGALVFDQNTRPRRDHLLQLVFDLRQSRADRVEPLCHLDLAAWQTHLESVRADVVDFGHVQEASYVRDRSSCD